MNRFKTWTAMSLASLAAVTVGTTPVIAEPSQCAAIESDLQRLQSYDAFFQSDISSLDPEQAYQRFAEMISFEGDAA